MRHNIIKENKGAIYENFKRIWKKSSKKIKYKGFTITIETIGTPYGTLYRAYNNIGEPNLDSLTYKTEKQAVDIEKKNINDYINETV